jgi:hypothetical protein
VTAAVLFALFSALCYGSASALQHQATARAADEPTMSMGLLARLARDPRWLAGNGLDVAGFAFQFLALRHGALTLVEPLLVLSLLVSFPLRDLLSRRRPAGGEVFSAGITALGLGAFLAASQPGPGIHDPSIAVWLLVTLLVATVVVGALAAAESSQHRGLFLAASSGTAFGYMAAMVAATWERLGAGITHVFTSPDPYAFVVAGVVAIVLMQSAFHAGELALSLPTLTVTQPIVAMVIGLSAFGETINTSAAALVVEGTGLLAMVAGVFALGRSGQQAQAGLERP